LSPFGEWHRDNGGYEYRGVRTERYTYVRSLKGPEVLYDNLEDAYQQQNLVDHPELAGVQAELEARLQRMLDRTGDEFLPGDELLARWGYLVDQGRTTHICRFTENVPWEKYKPVWEWWEEED
jgi:hypothetical protein